MSTDRYLGLRDYWLRYPDVAIPTGHNLAKLRLLRRALVGAAEVESCGGYAGWDMAKATYKQLRLTNYAIDNIIRRMPA